MDIDIWAKKNEQVRRKKKRRSYECIYQETGGEDRDGFVADEGEEALEPCLWRREERVPPSPGYKAEEKQMLALKMATGLRSCELKQRNEDQGRRERGREKTEDVVRASLLTAEAAKPHTRTQSCSKFCMLPPFSAFYLNGRLTLLSMPPGWLNFICIKNEWCLYKRTMCMIKHQLRA